MQFLVLIDWLFWLLHIAWIGFLLAGWAWRATRPYHLAACAVTAFSWFGLGLRYGFGYCPITDWHWQIKRRLGHFDLPHSFVELLLEQTLGLHVPSALVDWGVGLTFLVVTGLSVAATLRHRGRGGV